MSKSPSPVRVLAAGAALSVGLAACSGSHVTENPPPPPEPTVNPPDPQPTTTANPPARLLPTWDVVESGHPEGATNPPMPVLVAREDGSECWKAWYDPRAVPPEARQKGGIVLDADEAVPDRATQIQCPADQLQELMEHHANAEKAAEEAEQDAE